MTEPPATEVIPLELVACETCDNAFLSSGRRQTCPGCGGAAGLTLSTYEASANGLRQTTPPGLADPVAAPPAAPPPAAAPPPPAPEPQVAEPTDTPDLITPAELFPVAVGSYLDIGFPSPADLTSILLDLGADPEVAATATGRLTAVRDLYTALTAALATTPPGSDTETAAAGELAPEDIHNIPATGA